MKRKLFAGILAVVLALSLLPMAALAEEIGATTISADTTWNEAKTLTGNLTVSSGVTLTIGGQITIDGNVTISGSGTIKSNAAITGTTIGNETYNNMILVNSNKTLTLENITIDGGAKWSELSENSTEQETLLGHGLTNTGVTRTGSRADSGAQRQYGSC